MILGPRDQPDAFRWHFEVLRGQKVAAPDRKANGECVYLTPAGCGIHGSAPEICKRMDCRVLYLLQPADLRQLRVVESPNTALVYDAGRERLESLRD